MQHTTPTDTLIFDKGSKLNCPERQEKNKNNIIISMKVETFNDHHNSCCCCLLIILIEHFENIVDMHSSKLVCTSKVL